jgi:hypothetical protein
MPLRDYFLLKAQKSCKFHLYSDIADTVIPTSVEKCNLRSMRTHRGFGKATAVLVKLWMVITSRFRV